MSLQLSPSGRAALIDLLRAAATAAHVTAISKGFWDDASSPKEDGNKMAFIHSEISEAYAALRAGNPPDAKCPQFSSLEIELADAVILILDFVGSKKLDLGGAILAKMDYNTSRPFRNGKVF